MYTSLVAFAGLCVLVCASPEHVKRQNSPSLASVLSQISSLEAKLEPPESIFSELTGIPSTVTAAFANPSAISVIESQINASGFPGWFSSLVPDAQNWLISVAGVAATVIPEIVSLEVAAGLITVGDGTGTAPATTTTASTKSYSNSTMSTTSKPTPAPTTKASSTPVPSKSSSAGAAPTNVAAGILGVVGFLGLVAAL